MFTHLDSEESAVALVLSKVARQVLRLDRPNGAALIGQLGCEEMAGQWNITKNSCGQLNPKTREPSSSDLGFLFRFMVYV